MDVLDSLRACALRDVLSKNASRDYNLRAIFRYYAKTFHTPLHVVQDLPLVDVFQAYFEENFEAMEYEDLEAERQRLIETPEQRAARADAEVDFTEEADEFAAEVAAMEKEEQLRLSTLPGYGEPQLVLAPKPSAPAIISQKFPDLDGDVIEP